MGERQAKLRRLFAASSIPHRQIVAMLGRLRAEEDIEDALAVERGQLDRAIASLGTSVGQAERLATAAGGSFEWATASLPKLLQRMVAESPAWATEFSLAFARRPCSQAAPFHLLVYTDEATPGNVLRLDNRRKTAAFYVSIQEFRGERLKHEGMWLPIACIRSSVAKTVQGGMSACMARLYRRWFIDEALSDRGVLLDLSLVGGGSLNIYLAAGPLIADGEALRAVWNSKGAAGKMPCPLCKNIINDDEAAAGSEYLEPLSCPDPRRFDLASDADLWEKADSLQAQKDRLSRSAFEQLQKAYGISFAPEGLLWDMELRRHVRPRSILSFDAMHCVLSNGIAQNETALLFAALHRHHIGWGELRLFVSASWQTSRACGSPAQLRESVSAIREKICKDSGGFKSGASEMLMLLPLVEHFLDTIIVPRGLCGREVESFRALARVQRCIRQAKEGERGANELEQAIGQHLTAFLRAYGPQVKPKNHYLLHLPLQVARDGVLFDAFVGERKHIALKKAAEVVRNTAQFERTTLFRCLASQLVAVSEPDYLRDRLISPQPFVDLASFLGVERAEMSKTMIWHGALVGVGDALWIEGRPHVVKACASIDDALHVVASPYAFVEQVFLANHRSPQVCSGAKGIKHARGGCVVSPPLFLRLPLRSFASLFLLCSCRFFYVVWFRRFASPHRRRHIA